MDFIWQEQASRYLVIRKVDKIPEPTSVIGTLASNFAGSMFTSVLEETDENTIIFKRVLGLNFGQGLEDQKIKAHPLTATVMIYDQKRAIDEIYYTAQQTKEELIAKLYSLMNEKTILFLEHPYLRAIAYKFAQLINVQSIAKEGYLEATLTFDQKMSPQEIEDQQNPPEHQSEVEAPKAKANAEKQPEIQEGYQKIFEWFNNFLKDTGKFGV